MHAPRASPTIPISSSHSPVTVTANSPHSVSSLSTPKRRTLVLIGSNVPPSVACGLPKLHSVTALGSQAVKAINDTPYDESSRRAVPAAASTYRKTSGFSRAWQMESPKCVPPQVGPSNGRPE